MKKIILAIFFTVVVIFISIIPVNASELSVKENFDESISDILNGINESDFIDLTNLLNDLFNDDKTIKEWVITFITGENILDLSNLKEYISKSFSSIVGSILELVSYVLFIGIVYTVSNIIICKKTDNTENNIIYFICYFLVVTLFVVMISKIFELASKSIENMSKTVQVSFPLLVTLGEFCGGFGAGLYKPMTAISSFLSSVLFANLFLPLISTCFTCVIIGNISPQLKLSGLSKTILSFIKWIIGVIVIVFTLVIAVQGAVNSQFNGLSFKIFKYATGSMIPIVGNFISGGLDTLVSSAIIVKNSFGLILIVYLLFMALRSGVVILLSSFILRFFISLSEPILDSKFVNLSTGVCEVLNVLTAVLFISAFSYVLVSLTIINSTSLIF